MFDQNTAVVPFHAFRGHRVRYQLRDSQLFLCLPDTCQVLQLSEAQAETLLDADEHRYCRFPTAEGGDEGLFGVTFEGLLTLVENSQVPHARDFRRWVNHDILGPLLSAQHLRVRSIDSPVSNWQVRMQKEHWFRATRAIDEVLSSKEIKRYGVDRVKGITGYSPNYWREKAERYEQAFGLRLTKEVKDSAINLVRIFAEVDAVLIGLADDIVGLGVFEPNINPPWDHAIGLAKGFRQPMQALYDAGIRLNHEAGSALERTQQRLEALPGVADASQLAISPLFAPEQFLPTVPEIMAPQPRSEFYVTYMASPSWSAIRETVLRRAQHVCEWCQEQRAIEVHHLTYQNLGQEEDHLDDLVALCESCHERADQQRWDANFWKRAEGYARKKYSEVWEMRISRQALAEEFESWLNARHPPHTGICGAGCASHRRARRAHR